MRLLDSRVDAFADAASTAAPGSARIDAGALTIDGAIAGALVDHRTLAQRRPVALGTAGFDVTAAGVNALTYGADPSTFGDPIRARTIDAGYDLPGLTDAEPPFLYADELPVVATTDRDRFARDADDRTRIDDETALTPQPSFAADGFDFTVRRGTFVDSGEGRLTSVSLALGGRAVAPPAARPRRSTSPPPTCRRSRRSWAAASRSTRGRSR